jgi:hypothetical protein
LWCFHETQWRIEEQIMANFPRVPDVYKGKDTNTMSRAEYEKMLQELGINKKGVKPTEYPGEEPDTAPVKKAKGGLMKKYAKGGDAKAFKPCKGCPTPAKCKAAGKCLAKKAAGGTNAMRKGAAGMLIIPVKVEKSTATKYAGMKAAAKKKKVKK